MEYFVHIKRILSIYLRMQRPKPRDNVSPLFDRGGHRKYLTLGERRAFLSAASSRSPEIETFCTTLAYTGARISEVLALTPDRIDLEMEVIIIETLKRRQRGLYRAVPVPKNVLLHVATVHGLAGSDGFVKNNTLKLWPWGRTTAWKRVKNVMKLAGIDGPKASPKGLRHAFGVITLQSGVPLNLVKRWLGHAKLDTTAIYAEAVGEEEKSIADRFWKTF